MWLIRITPVGCWTCIISAAILLYILFYWYVNRVKDNAVLQGRHKEAINTYSRALFQRDFPIYSKMDFFDNIHPEEKKQLDRYYSLQIELAKDRVVHIEREMDGYQDAYLFSSDEE